MRIDAHIRRGKMNRVRCTIVAVALALTAGCAAMPEHDRADTIALPQVRSFSSHPEGDALPPGWQPWILSRFKRSTAYRLVNEQGRTVVRARAESSASGLIHPLKLDPKNYPLLHWHWKVDDLIQKADNTQKHLEDSPVRLVVSFDGDIDKLDIRDRMFADNVRLLTGQQMPYATLMYIWENRAPRETVIENRHTSRIKMIVAESGRDRLGQWQEVIRNIIEDYRRAFGEEPGQITAIGIMTDTDNTGDNAHAWYGDIEFRKTAAPPVIAEK
jgi:hypothetical protein